jgi:hypothetical protein
MMNDRAIEVLREVNRQGWGDSRSLCEEAVDSARQLWRWKGAGDLEWVQAVYIVVVVYGSRWESLIIYFPHLGPGERLASHAPPY